MQTRYVLYHDTQFFNSFVSHNWNTCMCFACTIIRHILHYFVKSTLWHTCKISYSACISFAHICKKFHTKLLPCLWQLPVQLRRARATASISTIFLCPVFLTRTSQEMLACGLFAAFVSNCYPRTSPHAGTIADSSTVIHDTGSKMFCSNLLKI